MTIVLMSIFQMETWNRYPSQREHERNDCRNRWSAQCRAPIVRPQVQLLQNLLTALPLHKLPFSVAHTSRPAPRQCKLRPPAYRGLALRSSVKPDKPKADLRAARAR